MRKIIGAIAVCGGLAYGADWPTVGGSPQRDGWAKSETAFTKQNVKGLKLLYKYTADAADQRLTTPMVDTRLITYLGFKEMLVFAGSSGNVYSVDADLNRVIWKAHVGGASGACGGLTAPVAMTGSSTAGGGRGAGPRPPAGAAPNPAARRPNRGGEFYAVGADGNLHVLNTSTGADRMPPIPFVPAGSKVSGLNVSDNVIYAATLDKCGDHPDGLYAVDLSAAEPKTVSQPAQDGRFVGNAGTAIGTDGSVYSEIVDLHGAPGDIVVSLAPKTLEVKDYFLSDRKAVARGGAPTPVVFAWSGADFIAAAAPDGRMFLLDAKSLGGSDHKTPLFATEAGAVLHGSFASWEDPESKERWIYGASDRNIVGYKVSGASGHPSLTNVWTSADIAGASTPVIANGLVFSRGEKGLVALDAATGKELYSSGAALPAAAARDESGLAVANRRIYVTAKDHSVYCFGFLAEQPQLTGK